MQNILIVTGGKLPIPATKGGAIENLIENFMTINEKENKFSLTIVSASIGEQNTAYKNTKVVYASKDHLKDKLTRIYKKMIRKSVELLVKKTWYLVEYPNILKTLKRLLANNNFDKVIVLNKPEYILKIRKIYNGELIFYLHNDNLNKDILGNKKIITACDKIITISNFLKNRVKEIPIETKKIPIITVHNGLKIQKLTPNDRMKLRSEFNIPSDATVVIYTGRITYLKGISLLVEAIKSVPNSYLLVVGGAFYSETKKTKFIKKMEQQILENQIKVVFTGYVAHDKIGSYYQVADIAVVPSIVKEALSLSAMEAQMFELPLICSSQGGLAEARISESSLMLELDHDFINKLSEAINYLRENPVQRKRMGRAGRNFIEKERNIDIFFKDLAEAINMKIWSDSND